MTYQTEAQQGHDANLVLENPAFKEAMRRLRDDVVVAWKNAPIRDKEGQLLLLQLAKVADKFESILIGMVRAGEFAQEKVDAEEKRKERDQFAMDDIRNESPARRMLRKVF